MANIKINNVSIRGIAVCVPETVEENINLNVFKEGEAERVISQTGIERKHKVKGFGITASDMCAEAFTVLIEGLGWSKDSIDLIGFVTLTPDYLEPPTACVLHGRLGLSTNCMALDLTQGCPGWVNGLASLSSLLSSGGIKRAVLMNGDTATLMRSPYDKESLPLFGDAGVATALEFNTEAPPMFFNFGTRGKDFKAIYRHAGGFRNPITEESLKFKKIAEHIERRDIDAVMDGMGVISFGISMGPKSVKELCEVYGIRLDEIDYFAMHQANQYLNEKIRKKLDIPPEKTLYSLKDFGNTSGASIPVTLVSQRHSELSSGTHRILACAFGVGLAWGSAYFTTDNIFCPNIIMYHSENTNK